MVEWVDGEVPGRRGVQTPYNAAFVHDLKAIPSARFSRYPVPVWFFDEEVMPDVLALVDRYFGQRVWQRVTWLFKRDRPAVDGASLAQVGRDYWRWQPGEAEFRVVEDAGITSGGSRSHPGLYGRAVVDVLARPDAVFEPAPESVELIGEEREAPNPLAVYPDDALLAELHRRGYEVEVSA